MQEYGVRDFCHNMAHKIHGNINFQFIYQHQKQDENLVRSLWCLCEKRLLVMLYFHIENHCFRGMDILDDTKEKSVFLYAVFKLLGIDMHYAFVLSPEACHINLRRGNYRIALLQNQFKFGCRIISCICGIAMVNVVKVCGSPWNIRSNSTLKTHTKTFEYQETLNFIRGLKMVVPGTWGNVRTSI